MLRAWWEIIELQFIKEKNENEKLLVIDCFSLWNRGQAVTQRTRRFITKKHQREGSRVLAVMPTKIMGIEMLAHL